ncbi:ash family protein [Salmonella enterica]|nr:ash family protein [Salmonella enterica]EHC3791984.1 ash family protein [Salmonella enterica subsp. enterica serovar Panama]EFR0655226.1 ash family protein [Salmonella enterica]EFU7764332.1 ash family protein [Salmonella enterica]EGK2195961.1 ash family protein [Salmonella enterica]
MTTHKNRLPPSALMGYISPAPHKTGAGIETPPNKIAHNRASGFFTRKASSRLFRIMAGRMGPLSGGPVSILSGSLNPVRLATPSLRPLGGELPFIKIGAPSWQTANSAARMLRASIRKPKSTAVCSAPDKYPQSCVSICCLTTHTPSLRYILHLSLAIWLTICGKFRSWQKLRANNASENPTIWQHSTIRWGVCLSVGLEVL